MLPLVAAIQQLLLAAVTIGELALARFVGHHRRMHFRVWCALTVALLSSTAFGKSLTTTAEGVATLTADIAACRDTALANALQQAVSLVAGQWIESEFSARQAELTDKNRTEFVSNVSTQVRVDTKGFVEHYKIVKEEQAGGLYRVTVEATVNTKKLNDTYVALSEALNKRAFSAWVVARERTEPASQAPALAPSFIEGELAKVGLTVKPHRELYSDDVVGLARRAREASVDVVLVVDAYYKNLGVIGPGAEFEALVGQTRVELSVNVRSILTNNARVLSSQPVTMSSIGINFERAVARALTGTGENAIRKSLRPFFEQLLIEVENVASKGPGPAAAGSPPLAVVIRKVKSYRHQAKPLMEIISGIKGVTKLREVSFKGEELQLSLEFSGDSNALADAILAGTDHKRCCGTIDRVGGGDAALELAF